MVDTLVEYDKYGVVNLALQLNGVQMKITLYGHLKYEKVLSGLKRWR